MDIEAVTFVSDIDLARAVPGRILCIDSDKRLLIDRQDDLCAGAGIDL